jgi:hypothetical protein
MGLIGRFFSQRRAGREAVAADVARSRILSGQAVGQTGDEQMATRSRMEAELDAQRTRREQPPAPVT